MLRPRRAEHEVFRPRRLAGREGSRTSPPHSLSTTSFKTSNRPPSPPVPRQTHWPRLDSLRIMATATSPPLILVRSSLNIDEIVRVPHTVRPGETLASTSSQRLIGGKGANISVAAAQGLALPGLRSSASHTNDGGRSGGAVYLAGGIGPDGAWILPDLQDRGVTTHLVHEHPDNFTGTAFIQVTGSGENSIVLRQGANFASSSQLDDPRALYRSVAQQQPQGTAPSVRAPGPTVVLLHNEIPFSVTRDFISYRANQTAQRDTKDKAQCPHHHAEGGECILWNPSPMPSAEQLCSIPWAGVDVLVINEGEAEDLLRVLGHAVPDQPRELLLALRETEQLQPVPLIVLTRGSRGVLAHFASPSPSASASASAPALLDVPAAKVTRVADTTGAGDTFTGYLAAAIARAGGLGALLQRGPEGVQQALAFTSLAAALAVEREGAMKSIPAYDEVLARWNANE